jgi:dUTP pyrophosphatase
MKINTSLKVKKLFPDSILPRRADPTASGLDVFIHHFEKIYLKDLGVAEIGKLKSLTLKPGERALIATGLSVAVDPGFEVQVRPRSGIALNKGLTVLNTPGTIDSNYRGPVNIILINLDTVDQVINIGDKIAQLVVAPVILAEVIEVDDLDKTDRGENGFGSTGV